MKRLIRYLVATVCLLPRAQGAERKFEIRGTMEPPGSAAILGLSDPAGHLVATAPSDLEDNFHFRNLAPNRYTVFILVRARWPGRVAGARGVRPVLGPWPVTTDMRIVGEARSTVRVDSELADSKGRVNLVVNVPAMSATAAQERYTVPLDRVGEESRPARGPRDAVIAARDGMFRLLKNDLEGAIRNYQRATEIDPENASAWNFEGVLAYYLGHYQEAESYFRSALAEDPDAASSYAPLVNLGGVLNREGKFREAAPFNEKAYQRRPDDFQAAAQTCVTQFALHNFSQAATEIAAARKLNPAWLPQPMLAEIDLEKGDRAAAVRELEEYLKLAPDGTEAGEVRAKLDELQR